MPGRRSASLPARRRAPRGAPGRRGRGPGPGRGVSPPPGQRGRAARPEGAASPGGGRRPRRPGPAAPRSPSGRGASRLFVFFLLGSPRPSWEVLGALGEQGGRAVETGAAFRCKAPLFLEKSGAFRSIFVLISVKLYPRKGEVDLKQPSVCRAELGGGGWLWSFR